MAIPVEISTWAHFQSVLSRAVLVGIIAQMLALMFNKHDPDKAAGFGSAVIAFCVWGSALISYSLIARLESARALGHNPRFATALYVIALAIGNIVVWLGCIVSLLFTRPPPPLVDHHRIQSGENERGDVKAAPMPGAEPSS